MSKLYEVIFDQCKMWVKKKRNKGVSWGELRYACKKDDVGLNEFLKAKKEDDDWPEELDADLWKELIDELEDAEMNILASRNRDSGAVETYIPDTEIAFDWLNYHS